MADGSIIIDVQLRQAKAKAAFEDITAKIVKQKAKVDELTEAVEAYERIVTAQQRNSGTVSPDAQTNLDRVRADLNAANAQLDVLGLQAQRAAEGMNATAEGSGETSKKLKAAAVAVQRFSIGIGSMVKSALVFNVISNALGQLRTYIGAALKANDRYAASMAALKGQLLALFQPIYDVAVPALSALLSLLAKLTGALVNFLSLLFGQDYAGKARELYAEAKGIDAVGDAAKAASKSLAGFDQINRLDGSEAAGGGAAANPESMPDFDLGIGDKVNALELLMSEALLALGAILTFSGSNLPLGIALMTAGAAGIVSAAALNWNAVKKELQGRIGAIMGVVSGALLVLGAIFTFSGANIPMGISLMLIGAAGLATAVAINWNGITAALQGTVGQITLIVSGALLAIGALLAFSGADIPLGIGLMLAGAAGLAAVIAANWDALPEILRGKFAEIRLLVSTAFLALGAVLAFSGANLLLGIGLMAAGAVGLVGAIRENWDTLRDQLSGVIGEVLADVSAAALVIGAVLAFSGANLPLGIALIAAGAAGLVTVTALNWETVREKLQGPIGSIAVLASGALLVLGIILAFSGVATPLGIALIAAGAAGLVTVTAANWDALRSDIAGAWDGIRNWWRQHVAPVFTRAWWSERFSSISEGLKAKIRDGINGAISLFNRFVDWVNEKMNISWQGLNIGGAEIIPAGSFQLLTLKKIPELAKGAVIPPNREFMAVLGDQRSGTNIEAPLDTIVEAMLTALGGSGMTDAIVQMGNLIVAAINNKDTTLYINATRASQELYSPLQAVGRQRGQSLIEEVK